MRATRMLLTLLLLAPAVTAHAADQTLLIYLEQRSGALPNAVSASGAVVVGSLATGGGFYWMPTAGTVFIGGLGATKVSLDGHTIVGQVVDARLLQAGIWVRAAEWKALGSFTPTAAPCDASLSLATDTSGDGRVVVGYARNGCSVSHAFRWEESTGMVDLGSSVAGHNSFANGVSVDGKVVVGYQEAASGFQQGARWVDGRQELFTGTGPDGLVGAANAANKDGSIVVGRVCSGTTTITDPTFQSAWVWTAKDGLQCLAPPKRIPSPGPVIIVEANAASDDGRVIGGSQGIGSDDTNAIIWVDRSPFYLKDYLQANGVPDAFKDWINTGAITDVSPDGRILVGKGAAPAGFRGYVVILGEKP